jgi:hypothetical protein
MRRCLLLRVKALKFLGSSKFMRLLRGYLSALLSFLFKHLFSKLSIAIKILAKSDTLLSFLELDSSASLLSLFFWSSMLSNFCWREAMSLLSVMISEFMLFSYWLTWFFRSSRFFSSSDRLEDSLMFEDLSVL